MRTKILLTAVFAALLTFAFVFMPELTLSEHHDTFADSLLNRYVKTELYFGLSKNTGGYVTQEEWDAFEDSVIVKVFSSGSTTLQSRGRWLNENGDIIKEDSKIVIAVNEMTPELSGKINTIRDKYRKYFDQSSVLRIDYNAEVSF